MPPSATATDTTSGASDDHFNGQHVYNELHNFFAKRTVEEYAAHLLPYIEPHHQILDIGCGVGSITIGLARRVPQGSVLGIDVNPDLLTSARALASQNSIPNLRFAQSSAMETLTSLPSNSYDIIHTHQVLLYLPNQVSILREIHRVLRPGGVYGTRDNFSATMSPTPPLFSKFVESLLKAGAAAQGEGKEWGDFARYAHLRCAEAGFPWEGIRLCSPGVEVASCNGQADLGVFVRGLKVTGRAGIAKLGLMTKGELEEVEGVIENWAKLPEARYHMLDSACVARKE